MPGESSVNGTEVSGMVSNWRMGRDGIGVCTTGTRSKSGTAADTAWLIIHAVLNTLLSASR